ncbi:hypothetical protein TNCV_4716801 [Trichonephila clavipes]|nr:hypothetical protein TNCV_714821 [Trichonephila clavipes]GFV65681.1 hypothetical protein TNCV_4716801 [Trichonephila clavipes]
MWRRDILHENGRTELAERWTELPQVSGSNPGPGRFIQRLEWRTADNRPVCFHCGRPGHVMRYCRERKAVFE